MKARDFCFWLQGYFEIVGPERQNLTDGQTAIIKRHLAMVFAHDIDPSAGDADHQAKLNELHNGKPFSPFNMPKITGDGAKLRC